MFRADCIFEGTPSVFAQVISGCIPPAAAVCFWDFRNARCRRHLALSLLNGSIRLCLQLVVWGALVVPGWLGGRVVSVLDSGADDA